MTLLFLLLSDKHIRPNLPEQATGATKQWFYNTAITKVETIYMYYVIFAII